MNAQKLLVLTLLLATSGWAANVMAQLSDPASPSSAAVHTNAMPMPPAQSDTFATKDGEVTITSRPASAPVIGTPPPFEQLSGQGNSVSEEQASAYAPLANDFIRADRDHNGKITKAEYAHWMKHLK